EGAFTHGVRRIWEAVLNQRGRPVFTGGESFLYGLLPGMLNDAAPWLLWSHLVCLALFVGLSFWLLRRLRAPAWLYWAGVLASPALVSHAIVGLPDLPSNALAWGLAIGWVLGAAQTGRRGFPSARLLHGMVATLRAYVVDWYIDFPALAIAAVIGLLVLRRNRLFWVGVFGVVLGLVTLNAFQFDGGFLVPHRFLLLGFISALIVA